MGGMLLGIRDEIPRLVLGTAVHNGGRRGLEEFSFHEERILLARLGCTGYAAIGDGGTPELVELASEISEGASEICDAVGDRFD